jgi:hypothetical protein
MTSIAENRGDEAVHDVYKAEKRRGRRPIDAAKQREKQEVARELLKAVQQKDERAFLSALRRSGVKDGTDEFARALRVFRELMGQS